MPQTIQSVIFDMDGVLCDSEPFIAEAACRMFAERHSVKVRPEDFHPFVGMGEDRFLGGVAETHGVRLALPKDKDRTYAIYLELIRGRLRPLPGVADFVARCHRCNLKLAIATSADRVKLVGNLRELRLPATAFDACVTGSEVARKKPFPDLFLAAAGRLGVPPKLCVVVEDAPSGIEAARRAGMRSLGLTSSFSVDSLSAAGATWIAANLAHVPESLMHLLDPKS